VVSVEEQLTFVIYDVQDDRTRMRVADACKDYGLDHIQYSAFSGYLDGNRRRELFARLADTLGSRAGRILVVPVCERDAKLRCMVQNQE
jgi:CRISPR-associated protein Cas2